MKTTLIALCLSFAMGTAFSASQPTELWMTGNPATTNCAANHQGSLYMATDRKTGGQYGICHLSPALAVEEWCLFRNDQNIEKKDCPNLIILLNEGVK